MKKSNFFWVSYSDLMTSLFFIMMVLFAITVTVLKGNIKLHEGVVKEIKNIQTALDGLDKEYFVFDSINKRYKLKLDASFKPNSYDIIDIPNEERMELLHAGHDLFNKIHALIDTNQNVDYLLVIEGNTQRYNDNYLNNPDGGYNLSYRRALSLVNYWKNNNIDFYTLGNQCELIIAGSGYFGQSRESDESLNRKFSIQVTSKVGKYLEKIEK
jgi:hypothetical protein